MMEKLLTEASYNFAEASSKDVPEEDRLSFDWVWLNWYTESGVMINIVMNYTNCELIRGSFLAFTLVFEKLDPWCPWPGFNGQPEYIDTDCGWTTENATSNIVIFDGYFDGECACGPYEIWFGLIVDLYYPGPYEGVKKIL